METIGVQNNQSGASQTTSPRFRMTYPFELQPLPWMSNALPNFLSSESINLQYQLYQKYIEQMNEYAEKYTELQNLTLGEIINRYPTRIGEVAAEATNQPFFWKNLVPVGGGNEPSGRLYQMIENQFGSWEEFKEKFTNAGMNLFGSGWVWLIYDPTTTFLQIIPTEEGYNPIKDGFIPLLSLNLWEHAYWMDYGPNKRAYIDNFWDYINWTYLEQILAEYVFGYRVRVDMPGKNETSGLSVR
jgi:Fe-Mn family superoxide dismutase